MRATSLLLVPLTTPTTSFRPIPERVLKSTVDKLIQDVSVRRVFHSSPMANSKWTYVKSFELDDKLLPNSWIVARLDGRGFHKLAKSHNWKRPNDIRALNLMNHAAKTVVRDFNPIILAYGQSDEYSFVFKKDSQLFERRSSKLITTLVSKFTSAYVFHWSTYFPDQVLQYPPSFDGRIVLYPTDQNLRDYLCWRQADCHINNLYNTVFWALVQDGGMTNTQAEQRLSKTLAADKNEILFSQFSVNYNCEPELFRKGTVLVKRDNPKPKHSRKQFQEEQTRQSVEAANGSAASEAQVDEFSSIIELNCDIIRDQFWNDYPHLLFEKNAATEATDDAKNNKSSVQAAEESSS